MKRLYSFSALVLCLALMFCGCGKNAAGSKTNETADEAYSAMPSYSGVQQNKESATGGTDSAAADRKLIKTVRLSVETANYAGYTDSLREAVKGAGGYIESYEESEHSDRAHCIITLRIPAEAAEDFCETAQRDVTVKSRSENVNDVTSEYIDTEARMRALEAEEENLLELLKKAGSVSEILTVRERLSKVRGDIEAYKATLTGYDSLVSFSTVTITVDEVARETQGESVWTKIGNNFASAAANISDFFVGLFVLLLAILPYMVIIGAVVTAVLYFAYLRPRKRRREKAKQKDENIN